MNEWYSFDCIEKTCSISLFLYFYTSISSLSLSPSLSPSALGITYFLSVLKSGLHFLLLWVSLSLLPVWFHDRVPSISASGGESSPPQKYLLSEISTHDNDPNNMVVKKKKQPTLTSLPLSLNCTLRIGQRVKTNVLSDSHIFLSLSVPSLVWIFKKNRPFTLLYSFLITQLPEREVYKSPTLGERGKSNGEGINKDWLNPYAAVRGRTVAAVAAKTSPKGEKG